MVRSFYENDDSLVIGKPGSPTTEISPELESQESSHGYILFVQGMGVRTAPYLELFINKFRLATHDKLSVAEAEVSNVKSAVYNEVHSISNEISTTIQEPVLPNLIYILTLSLTGSILVRHRILPTRFVIPLAIGIAATSYFMPQTYGTLVSKYNNWEVKQFPEVHQQRLLLKQNYKELKNAGGIYIKDANVDLQRLVHVAREYVTDLLDV